MERICFRTFFLIASSLFSLGLTNTALAEHKTGTETVKLTQVYAVTMPGSRDPSMDGACKEKYGSYLGQTVTSKYDINTQTLIMFASSSVFGTPVELHPLGLSTSYSFMSDGVPQALADKGVSRVIFSIKLDYSQPESDVMADLSDTHNCVMSNLKM